MTRKIDPAASEPVFSNVSYFIFGLVTNDVAWAAAAFVKLLQHHAMTRSVMLDKEWDLLPNYLKYGTMTPSALLLMISHAEDRKVANQKSRENALIPISSYDWLRLIGWVSFVTNNTQSFQKVKDSLLSKLSQLTIPLGMFKGKYQKLDINESGMIVSDGGVVTIDANILHLIAALKMVADCHFELNVNDKDEWQLNIDLHGIR